MDRTHDASAQPAPPFICPGQPGRPSVESSHPDTPSRFSALVLTYLRPYPVSIRGTVADNVFIVVVIVIVIADSVFFDYDYDNDNRFADNDIIHQSCFRMNIIYFLLFVFTGRGHAPWQA
jgi:hypothetical protein